jgi:hypothetical protein
MTTAPGEWSYEQLTFISVLWLWRLSGCGFTELNQSDLTFAVVDDFFRAKQARYLRLLGRPDDRAASDLREAARSLARLRAEVEQRFVRCFVIDGGSWERREHFVPRASLHLDDIPADFVARLERTLGLVFPDRGDHRQRFGAYVAALDLVGVNPAEALVATARHVLEDPQLDAHYVVLTAARGVKLDQPWTLALTDVFSHVAIAPAYEPKPRGVRLSPVQIRTAIAQRMRYNVTRRARNYSPERDERLTAQPFQFPDVAFMEDAHHGGHRAAGIRLVARAPFVLELPGGDSWRGLADLRVNRASYKDCDRFTLEDLPRLIRYSSWCKAIVETTYQRGLLLDAAYCEKQVAEVHGPPERSLA